MADILWNFGKVCIYSTSVIKITILKNVMQIVKEIPTGFMDLSEAASSRNKDDQFW